MLGISALKRRLEFLEHRVAELSTRCAQLDSQLQKATGARIAAELEDLRSAADLVNKGVRRELGKIWKRIGDLELEEQTDAETPASPEATRAKLRAEMPLPLVRRGD